jgi:hypothetical protein
MLQNRVELVITKAHDKTMSLAVEFDLFPVIPVYCCSFCHLDLGTFQL